MKGNKTKLYSYVIPYDNGFAPNPFFGYCTLACCKPDIRRCAKDGNWVVGTGSLRTVGVNKMVYAMKVKEVLSFDEYSRDKKLFIKNGV